MDYCANIKNHVIDDLMMGKRFVTRSSLKSMPHKIMYDTVPALTCSHVHICIFILIQIRVHTLKKDQKVPIDVSTVVTSG